jgi:hypothetical protein
MLRKGQTFVLDGLRYRVAHVSSCRAHCTAAYKTPITVTNRRTGKTTTFERTGVKTLDISPDTPLELVHDIAKGVYR